MMIRLCYKHSGCPVVKTRGAMTTSNNSSCRTADDTSPTQRAPSSQPREAERAAEFLHLVYFEAGYHWGFEVSNVAIYLVLGIR